MRSLAATSSAVSARDPERGELGAGAAEPRAELLEVAVGQRAQDAEPLGLAQQPGAASPGVPALGELLGGDDLRLLVLERGLDRAGEAQHLLARAAGALEQAADRLELEAVGLKLADQLDPLLVVGAVEAGAPAHLRGGEQAARLVGADVADRHPGAPGELVDRQLFGSASAIATTSLRRSWRISDVTCPG